MSGDASTFSASAGEGDADRRQLEAATHQVMERRVLSHVADLMTDRRFAVYTPFGPRPVTTLTQKSFAWDRGPAVKRRMADLGVADFDLQDNLPRGAGFDVVLTRQVLLAFTQSMAHVRFASLPPTDALVKGEEP
ncbi:MAG: hypothetical protein AAGK78_12115, partial [Planctomycetota bacterium]